METATLTVIYVQLGRSRATIVKLIAERHRERLLAVDSQVVFGMPKAARSRFRTSLYRSLGRQLQQVRHRGYPWGFGHHPACARGQPTEDGAVSAG